MRQPARAITLLLSVVLFVTVVARYGSDMPGRLSTSLSRSGQPAQVQHQSGVAEAQVSSPACGSSALCFHDTARVRILDYEPGRAVDTRWVVFGAASDSIELSASSKLRLDALGLSDLVGFGISANHAARGYQERDTTGNTAPYVRFRLPYDGAVTVDIYADERGVYDTVAYTLSLRRMGAGVTPPLFEATGRAAALTLDSGRELDRFVIAPLGATDWAANPERWAVWQGRFKVALVPDSLYVVCKLPCERADTVVLKPLADVTRRY